MQKFNILFILLISFMLIPFVTQAQVSFAQQNSLIAGGCGGPDCAIDMNGDFLDDVVRFSGSGIYINYQQSDGSFIQQFIELDIEYAPDWSVAAGDLDNNGFNDLLLSLIHI